MSLSQLKQLFVVGFLGLTMTACSSGPEVDDASGQEATPVKPEQTAPKAEVKAVVEEVAEAKEAVKVKVEDAGGDDTDILNTPKITLEMRLTELRDAIDGKVVNFAFDQSDIQSEFRDLIKLHADYMSLNKMATVTLEGHCDERGSQEYNLALGERRANAVKNALVAEGVSPSRISVISFGEEKPLDMTSNEEAWAKNRRTEFKY